MRLRAWAGKSVCIHRWDEGAVVFSPCSGETYFLDPVAAEGALCLPLEWQDSSNYRVALSARLGIEDDQDLACYTTQLFARFEAAGLMEMEAI